MSTEMLGRACKAVVTIATFMASFSQIDVARAQDQITVRFEWTANALHLPYYLAIQRGWYKTAGLNVAVEDGSGSVSTLQLVGGGRFDVGHSALAPMALAIEKGLPVVSIAATIGKAPFGIVYGADARITSIKDLAGKKIMYTAGSFEGPFMQPFLERNGVSADKVSLINMDPVSKIRMFLTGQTDAYVTVVPTDVPLLASKPFRAFIFADHGLNLQGYGLVARRDALSAKGDAIKRFASVTCATWTYILNGHESEAARAMLALRTGTSLTEPILLRQLTEWRPYFQSDSAKNQPMCAQSPADWTATIRDMEQVKLVRSGTKPENYISNDYVDIKYGMRIVGGK